mmetsp:Transcript_25186/g.55228  ORF Transcript_25186/g.55228 Transcript_25186/m.55228 type:complete len:81 (+) Transcript_25186:2092-2334(+)
MANHSFLHIIALVPVKIIIIIHYTVMSSFIIAAPTLSCSFAAILISFPGTPISRKALVAFSFGFGYFYLGALEFPVAIAA